MEAYDLHLLWHGLLGASLLMGVLYARQRQTLDATPVDMGWSSGIGLTALYVAWQSEGDPQRRLLVGALAALWSLRLTWHLHARRGAHEDGRYAMLRQQWGLHAQRNFLLLYQAQALLIAFFSLPILLGAANPKPLGALDALAAGIWLLATAGESLADAQLARFRRDPNNAGHTCAEGLWRYSRHPNYFFEWLHWFAYVPLATPFAWGWLSLLAPALMLYLLFSVTGIPYAEKRAVQSRGDEYRAYQQRTHAFFPFFPKEPVQRAADARTREVSP